MNASFLFPHSYKKIGWLLFVPAVIIGLITVITEYEPTLFDFRVPAIFFDELFSENKFLRMVDNNILNEILGCLTIVSAILVAFSKEKLEDEYISKIRLESLVWAVYVNYGILFFSFLLIYDLAFYWVMVFNMFTILLFFIIRFNWQIFKLKN